jgi:ParB-like chromosome segregation protein Spo0J
MTEPPKIDFDNLTFHPLAETFPLISGDELNALTEDIRKNGLLEKITIFEHKILDGRNRYLAAKAAGVKLVPTHFRPLPDGAAAWDFVVSENIQRRHLTQDQKREVIAALLLVDPSKSDRAIAAVAKVDNKTVAAVRGGLVSGEEIPHPKQRVGKDGKKQSGTKKGKATKAAPHVVYKRKQEELIDLLKETHTSYGQAEEWVDDTKQRLDQTLAGIAEELDQQNAIAA